MDNQIKEIAYNLLQNEYLNRRNISYSEEKFDELINVFPQDWFNRYSLDNRIDIISLALKNNIDINEALEIKQNEKSL